MRKFFLKWRQLIKPCWIIPTGQRKRINFRQIVNTNPLRKLLNFWRYTILLNDRRNDCEI